MISNHKQDHCEPITPKHIDDYVTLLMWSADQLVGFAAVLLIEALIGKV